MVAKWIAFVGNMLDDAITERSQFIQHGIGYLALKCPDVRQHLFLIFGAQASTLLSLAVQSSGVAHKR
jgi:hypothetical protein